ncbi:MAG: dipeptidase PepE [Flavobacteriaceae bacterium]
MKKCIIASTSTLYDGAYLDYLLSELEVLFNNVNEILFIPYAQPGGISYNTYTEKAAEAFQKINKKVVGLHLAEKPAQAIEKAKGIFTGGGNTFRLVNQLYKQKCMSPLREAILSGVPYLGTSAGSNICGVTMQTTNDMPIIYPPSFKTLGIIPFNLNPHYLEPDMQSKHMGETRETRIKEFHSMNTIPVLGLREGSWLEVNGENILLKGQHRAIVFKQGEPPHEAAPDTDFKNLK